MIIIFCDSITRGELEVLQDGTTVWANRWCPDGPPPPAMAPMLDCATDDPAMDAMWQASIDIAFLEQDKPTIEAQQAMIALHDATDIDDGLRPVVLGSDAGPVRCRHVMKKLRDSDGVELPDPRNPALSELVENSRGSYDGRVTPIV